MSSSEQTARSGGEFDVEELQDLYEHAPCGYLSLEPDGCIDRVNTTFLNWIGHSQEALHGRRFQDLLNIAGKIYFETHFAPLLRLQGYFDEVALDLVAKDGSLIPVLVNAVEKCDADGKPVFIRVTVFNATSRRLYERELLATRNQLDATNKELRAFYDTLPVGIFRTDASGGIVESSRRFCSLFGIDRAEEWQSVILDDDRLSTSRELTRAVLDGAPFQGRFRVANGDAVTRHIEIKAVPIHGTQGDLSAFVGVVEDVTEQVFAEAQRLQIDRDAATRQLTGGLAHNLNNILMVVMGNIEILEEDLADRPALRQTLSASLVATERAAALVNRLLIYSGYSTFRDEVLEIDQYLTKMEETVSDQFGARHKFTWDLCAHAAFVELDADVLTEAITELVSNAVNATPAGGTIQISTRWREQKTGDWSTIVVSVTDTGAGMAQETIAKAREPFFTTREVGQGMGLGLSFVDGIARIAGGELRMSSETGKGTIAEMHLPAKWTSD